MCQWTLPVSERVVFPRPIVNAPTRRASLFSHENGAGLVKFGGGLCDEVYRRTRCRPPELYLVVLLVRVVQMGGRAKKLSWSELPVD
jgi:hypothetical protein